MTKVDWMAKLSSRKFWALIAALITSVLILLKVDEGTIAQVVAVVGAFASIAVYILAEASIDAARAGQPVIDVFIEEE